MMILYTNHFYRNEWEATNTCFLPQSNLQLLKFYKVNERQIDWEAEAKFKICVHKFVG